MQGSLIHVSYGNTNQKVQNHVWNFSKNIYIVGNFTNCEFLWSKQFTILVKIVEKGKNRELLCRKTEERAGHLSPCSGSGGSVFERSFFTVGLCWGDFNLGQRRIKVFCITLPPKLRSFYREYTRKGLSKFKTERKRHFCWIFGFNQYF